MRPIHFILTVCCVVLPLVAGAQVFSTNLPATEIENFELQTGAVIVKGFSDVGSVTTEGGVVSVRSKESNNVWLGRKMYGISVALDANQIHGYLVVDYDELDSMIRALDYFGKISYDVSPMQGFDATFTTRSGLRIGAHTERRQTGIELFLQFSDAVRVPLTAAQFTQFQNLIGQAKSSIDLMKSKTQGG